MTSYSVNLLLLCGSLVFTLSMFVMGVMSCNFPSCDNCFFIAGYNGE